MYLSLQGIVIRIIIEGKAKAIFLSFTCLALEEAAAYHFGRVPRRKRTVLVDSDFRLTQDKRGRFWGPSALRRTYHPRPVPPKTGTECLVEHLERADFVVMKWPVIGGGAALARGFEG